MKRLTSIPSIERAIIACEACPRLRSYCTEIGVTKRRAYADQTYWTKPVPGFGDPTAWLWIVGLAPAAHGANRTGRMFTGDRSGDFLYAALHRMGWANQPTSVSRDDGLKLTGVFISSAARCAPPDNKPTPEELTNCQPFLDQEWAALKRKRVILALGKIGWDAAIAMMARNRLAIPAPRPTFGHAAQAKIGDLWLIGSYHVSQQNTFTGKLTPAMFDAVLKKAKKLATDEHR